MTLPETISVNIKLNLWQRGWNQTYLEKMTGLSHQTVYTRLKDARTFSIGELMDICKGFGIPFSDLFQERK